MIYYFEGSTYTNYTAVVITLFVSTCRPIYMYKLYMLPNEDRILLHIQFFFAMWNTCRPIIYYCSSLYSIAVVNGTKPGLLFYIFFGKNNAAFKYDIKTTYTTRAEYKILIKIISFSDEIIET